MANQTPTEEFQSIYDNIYASMGDDATLQANIEAALRPLYEQSKQQLEAERIARNADIDVDAFSRGMGNSTWVTDAKLRQLRSSESALASLDASYNNQLYNALLAAQQNRDDTAWDRAMQMYQLGRSGRGGGGGNKQQPTITDNFEQFMGWMADFNAGNMANKLDNNKLGQPVLNFAFGGRK